jgi:FkbM family methyltransferase
MRSLQSAAKLVAGAIGRESWVIRSCRPAYESALHWMNRKSGTPWTINGVEYRIDPRQRHRLGNVYDPTVAEFLRARVRDGDVCFDVGANVGVYVLQFAHWSRPSGRVLGFEPNGAARRALRYHVEVNGIADRVTIVPAAVGSSTGTAILYAADADGRSRLNAANTAIADQVQQHEVQVITLDEYVDQTALMPDVLMLDIEGFEIAALTGAKRLIQKNRKLLMVVEMHPNVWSSANTSRRSAETLLDELQLTPHPLQGQSDPLAEHGSVHLRQRED